jgi:hypothetical protein
MKQSEARSLIEAKVTIDDKGCWLWPGESEQYSTVTINGKYYGAHRLSWLAYRGRIGKMHVLHSCDVPKCVNPEHLFLGTHADNMADMVAKDRHPRETEHHLGKLTDDQVRKIRALRADGVTARWIADHYGITPGYVRQIVRRRVNAGGRATRYRADMSSV